MSATRSSRDRVADVRRVLDAASRVFEGRARLTPALVAATGLSAEGVELGFGALETGGADEDLEALVASAGDAAHVHVVLSANVFVAAVRAACLARAAAPRVTLRPSSRDDVVARALVAEVSDPSLAIMDERDVGAIGADALHVYGRDETVAAARARARPGAVVTGHGAGLGAAVITAGADLPEAAEALALDVARFDQRGCLSPRVALVEGAPERATELAALLHERLSRLDVAIPRGALLEGEAVEARRWSEAVAFAGRAWRGAGHVVGAGPPGSALLVPPAGRHLHVASVASLEEAAGALAPLGRFLVALGSDDPPRLLGLGPGGVRLSALGRMQTPPLDGPVDRRTSRA